MREGRIVEEGMDETRRRLRDRSDATVIGYWNDRDGSISFMIAVEDELRARGYSTRDENSAPRTIPIPGNRYK